MTRQLPHFGAAEVLVYGRAPSVEYASWGPEGPEVKNIMDRTSCVTDPELDATYPSKVRSWAEVQTKDGRSVRNGVEYLKRDPDNALIWDEMKNKFFSIAYPVIPAQRQSEIISRIESLEEIADARELATLLVTE